MIKRESKLADETTNKVDILVSGNIAGTTGEEDDEDEDLDVSVAAETLLLEKGRKQNKVSKAKSADALTFAVINKRYELLGVAGQGGMAVVYKARDLKENRDVAVKVLDRDLANMDSVLERFQQEVAAASSMAHENLAAVYDSGVTDDGRPYIVMEYMRGQTLAQLLKKKAKLSLNEFADIFVQVAKGLAHAHRRGVVHRDIKPSNIMLYTDAKDKLGVKLLDFGIAKSLADIDSTSLHLTHTGQVIGSPFYMSPEQCRSLPIDTRSDIYSLGCVMFEAITGSVPFRGETALDTLYKHIHEPAPRVNANHPKLKPAEILASTIETTLMKLPEARYHTARELGKDLAKLTNWEDLPSDLEFEPEARKTEPVKEKSRFSATGIAITTAIGLSMLVCGTMISTGTQGPAPTTPEFANAKIQLGELWKLSEKAIEDQQYDKALNYAQRAIDTTSRHSNSIPHAVSLLKYGIAERRKKNFAVSQESLKKSFEIFENYLREKQAVEPLDVIAALSANKVPDLNRYWFELNGELATTYADERTENSNKAKSLYRRVEELFSARNEATNYPEELAKRYMQSLANLHFADKEYLEAARVQANIADNWGERLLDKKSDPTEDASFTGNWVSPFAKSNSNLHISLKQAGDSVSGTISLQSLPTRAIWKGTLDGLRVGQTASTTFTLSGLSSDNSSTEGKTTRLKSSLQGELSLTRYKNYLVARMYNYSGSANIELPYTEVLEMKPVKHAVSKK